MSSIQAGRDELHAVARLEQRRWTARGIEKLDVDHPPNQVPSARGDARIDAGVRAGDGEAAFGNARARRGPSRKDETLIEREEIGKAGQKADELDGVIARGVQIDDVFGVHAR